MSDWEQAERRVRAWANETGRTLVSVNSKQDATLGTAFWVQFSDGGVLAIERGGELLTEAAPASVDRFIALGGVAGVSAEDFLYLLRAWKALPAIAKPIEEHVNESLNPHFVRAGNVVAFVLHAARKSGGGSRERPVIPTQRATGAIGATGLTWTLADEDVPL